MEGRNQKQYGYLAEAYHRGKLSHAYILEGSASECREFAESFAKALLCSNVEQAPEGNVFSLKACGKCPACVKAQTGNHPDLIHIRHEKATVLSVGEIRQQLVEDISIKPYYGPYKIYIVPDAQLMNENAQNALLKTIEEPAPYGLILLLTDNADGFLQTIRSRCIRISMDPMPRDQEAEDLLNEDGHRVLEILEGVLQMDALTINKAAKELEGFDRGQVLQIMQLLFRDVLIYKSAGKSYGRLYFKAQEGLVQAFSKKLDFERLNRVLLAVEEAEARLKASVKAEAVYENLMLGIRRELRGR